MLPEKLPAAPVLEDKSVHGDMTAAVEDMLGSVADCIIPIRTNVGAAAEASIPSGAAAVERHLRQRTFNDNETPVSDIYPMPKLPVNHTSAAFEAVAIKKSMVLSPAEIYAECAHHGKCVWPTERRKEAYSHSLLAPGCVCMCSLLALMLLHHCCLQRYAYRFFWHDPDPF